MQWWSEQFVHQRCPCPNPRTCEYVSFRDGERFWPGLLQSCIIHEPHKITNLNLTTLDLLNLEFHLKLPWQSQTKKVSNFKGNNG